MNAALTRVFSCLVIHFVWLGLAALCVYLIAGGEASLAEATRVQYSDNPELLQQIRTDAVWRLIMWATLSLAASFILASIWLLIAQRQRPRSVFEGAGKRGIWVILLLADLFAMGALGYARIWRSGVQIDLAGTSMTAGTLTILAALILAYYTATAVSVKSVMRPSVPLSSFLPNLKAKA